MIGFNARRNFYARISKHRQAIILRLLFINNRGNYIGRIFSTT